MGEGGVLEPACAEFVTCIVILCLFVFCLFACICVYTKQRKKTPRSVRVGRTQTAFIEPSLVKEANKRKKGIKKKQPSDFDESILGGFILRIGDLQYNASVANQLNKLKREFTLN